MNTNSANQNLHNNAWFVENVTNLKLFFNQSFNNQHSTAQPHISDEMNMDKNFENNSNWRHFVKLLLQTLSIQTASTATSLELTTATKNKPKILIDDFLSMRKTKSTTSLFEPNTRTTNQLSKLTRQYSLPPNTKLDLLGVLNIKNNSTQSITVIQDFYDEDNSTSNEEESDLEHSSKSVNQTRKQPTTNIFQSSNQLETQSNTKQTIDDDDDDDGDSETSKNHSLEATSDPNFRDSTCMKSEPNQLTKVASNFKSDNQASYSMLEFAMLHFRDAAQCCANTNLSNNPQMSQTLQPQGGASNKKSRRLLSSLSSKFGSIAGGNSSNNGTVNSTNDWCYRELTNLVKFTQEPITASLLKLSSPQLNELAIESFVAVMQFMGDLPISQPENSPSNCKFESALVILANCHKFAPLRDELYCQLIKQTTNNRSKCTTSCASGWRLLSLLAAYFDCSDLLRPYLCKYFERAAYDKRRAHCAIAMQCVQNFAKTRKFGGRKNVPSIEEIAAICAGRNSKRQLYRLPGGTKRVVNTSSTTVVADVIEGICSKMLGIDNELEMREFSLYCIVDNQHSFETISLDKNEYILDVTTELARLSAIEPLRADQQFYLIFCRSVWHFPLKLDNSLYIEVVFNQIAPDYIEGLLLEVQPLDGKASGRENSRALVGEIARIAALLHKTANADYYPTCETVLNYLLPRPLGKMLSMKQAQHPTIDSTMPDKKQSGSSRSSNMSDEFDGQSSDDTALNNNIDHGNGNTELLLEECSHDLSKVSAQQWTKLVEQNWLDLCALEALDAKAQFLDIVSGWPLFGSTFFAVQLIERDLLEPRDFILALNRLGVQLLDVDTHEQRVKFNFDEIMSTRKVRSQDSQMFLDLKISSPMKKSAIVRIRSDEAHEISRLIKLYIEIDMELQEKHQNITSDKSGSETAGKTYKDKHISNRL